jgi:subtilisin-like proprotein convertase family protein
VTTGLDIASSFPNTAPTGQWRLLVRDTAAGDVGTVNTFNLHITSTN